MEVDSVLEDQKRITVQLKSEDGEILGSPFDLLTSTTRDQLELLCNKLLNLDEPIPCSFTVEDREILDNIASVIENAEIKFNAEKVMQIIYQPQAVFRVQAVTRCTSSLPGHGEAIVSVQFSPDGRYLASGSGDTTVRFWDVNTELPQKTCKSHANWVLCIAWSLNGKKLASACKDGKICLWNPETCEQIGKTLCGHKKWITCLAWQPLHKDGEQRLLASSSKDGDIRLWDTVLGQTVKILSGHTASVTCIRWGGEGLLYSASQDRTIKVWRPTDGILCRTLEGHGHWVNTMALNTDYVIRTGAFDPKDADIIYRDVQESRKTSTNAVFLLIHARALIFSNPLLEGRLFV